MGTNVDSNSLVEMALLKKPTGQRPVRVNVQPSVHAKRDYSYEEASEICLLDYPKILQKRGKHPPFV